MNNNNQKTLVSAILVAGVLIAGAILLKGSKPPAPVAEPQDKITPTQMTALPPIDHADRFLGDPAAKVTLVMYEDFQCPFCERFFSDSEKNIRTTYVDTGKIGLAYRDFAFLGEESTRAAEASRCAADQGKFWEYHDYLFTHQKGENEGAFADNYLKGFAKNIGLDTQVFAQCFESGKYADAVKKEKDEGDTAGVQGTPKGFILVDGKIVDTIDGAEPYSMIKPKLDAALK